jgi:hypothetical protein
LPWDAAESCIWCLSGWCQSSFLAVQRQLHTPLFNSAMVVLLPLFSVLCPALNSSDPWLSAVLPPYFSIPHDTKCNTGPLFHK